MTVIWKLFEQLLSQSSNEFKTLDNFLKTIELYSEFIAIIIVTILVLMLMIISKAFSGGLLSTYFGPQPRAMIDSMDALIDKKGLTISIFAKMMPLSFYQAIFNGEQGGMGIKHI